MNKTSRFRRTEDAYWTHVYPIDDLREHDTEGPACWCVPSLEGAVVIHNSADRREVYEQGRLDS